MVASPEYDLRTQAKIPLALGSLHNFIRIMDPDDEATDDEDEPESSIVHTTEINPDHLGGNISQAEKDRAGATRDRIAIAMWEDYQRVLMERGEARL